MAWLLFALCVLSVKCITCGNYDEEACEYRSIGTLSCVWDPSATYNCSLAFCDNFTESGCVSNNGLENCYWNTTEVRCKNANCESYSGVGKQAICEAGGESNVALDCKWNSGSNTCSSKNCSDFAADDTCENNGKYSCIWDGTVCDYAVCDDYTVLGETVCVGDHGTFIGLPVQCLWNGAACVSAKCSDLAEDKCESNGVVDCKWDGTCKQAQCILWSNKGKDTCVANNGKYDCHYDPVLNLCYDYGCSNFDVSEEACYSSHPSCHWSSNKCVEGSSINMSIPSLMLLLFFLGLFVF